MIFGIHSETLAGLPKSWGRFDNYVISMYNFLRHLLFQHLTLADTSAQGHLAAQQQHWHETPLPKADCEARVKSRWHWNHPSFSHKQWHLYRASLVACRSKLLSHTIVFWAFCKAVDYFRREITMEGYGSSRTGPPGTAGSLQSSARLCVARGSRKPTQPHARRMSSLLQYFLSIYCCHLGKGWITI